MKKEELQKELSQVTVQNNLLKHTIRKIASILSEGNGNYTPESLKAKEVAESIIGTNFTTNRRPGKSGFTGPFQPLFDIMSESHGLTLLFDEMSEIMDVCRAIDSNDSDSVESHLRKRIKELNAADSDFCRKRWDSNEHPLVRGQMREQSNIVTGMRQELESVLEFMKLPRFVAKPKKEESLQQSDEAGRIATHAFRDADSVFTITLFEDGSALTQIQDNNHYSGVQHSFEADKFAGLKKLLNDKDLSPIKEEIAKGSELSKAVDTFVHHLQHDADFYFAYQSNIAVPFMDEYNDYTFKAGEQHKILVSEDIRVIANRAAQRFLDLLINKSSDDKAFIRGVLSNINHPEK